MEPEEVVDLCESFFSDLEGEEEYWVEIRGRNRPAFKLVDVAVDIDAETVSLVVEQAAGLDDEDLIGELMDRAIAAINDEHEELSDFRFGFKLDTE